uniref:WW domain-containing protein n=1 Tax=Aureoumbra lagunensis TaxID=44058 RepID=A0A7S3JR45_9STRA|mmetsp:Transcript_13232/g.17655  ORF Transcript_13232/g.17655 Transcript_13232/m.17655 type:complete len:227 (+) Transcript_13232:9-689(+)
MAELCSGEDQEEKSVEAKEEGRKRIKLDVDELPEGWSEHIDEATGARYFWNAEMKTASWEKPRQEERKKATEEYCASLLGSTKKSEKTKWVKHSDPETGVPYFVNTETNHTQWEVPSEGFIDATVFSSRITTEAYQNYSTKATFNANTGQFTSATGQTHWETMGRPNDREGRMLSHYFDLSALDQKDTNGESKRKKIQQKYDWKKYREMKKREKNKRRVQALLNEP